MRSLLQERGFDPEKFAADFDNWKASFPAGEYAAYAFGKDGAYSKPKVNGKANTLMHVHLAPRKDPVARALWDEAWRLRRRKVSDHVLVYVHDQRHGYLLIYILDEPGAHAIATMEERQDAFLMCQFAAVADRFIQTGEVIA